MAPRCRPAGGLAGLALLLAACGSVPLADYGGAEALPEAVELAGVPFHAQDADQCGPAALATVLGAAGVARTPAELTAAVFVPQRRGSLQSELLAATRRAGLLPYVLDGSAEALLAEVAAGHPVLVLQQTGWAVAPNWHYAVLVGYDRRAQRLLLRSGSAPRLALAVADFDRSWTRAGRWAFVALPPERLPASATEARLLAAAVALEGVDPQAAGRAYGALLARWPGNVVARIGQGNAAWRRHDLAAAAAAYRQATAEHPQAADAWNNLAQVLHESGRRREALAAARRAVGLGGPRAETYAATLAAIAGGPQH